MGKECRREEIRKEGHRRKNRGEKLGKRKWRRGIGGREIKGRESAEKNTHEGIGRRDRRARIGGKKYGKRNRHKGIGKEEWRGELFYALAKGVQQ